MEKAIGDRKRREGLPGSTNKRMLSAERMRTGCQKLSLPRNADTTIPSLHVGCFRISCACLSTPELTVAREGKSKKLSALDENVPYTHHGDVSRGAGWSLGPNNVPPIFVPCL